MLMTTYSLHLFSKKLWLFSSVVLSYLRCVLRSLNIRNIALILSVASVAQTGWAESTQPMRWRATWWSDPATTIALGWYQKEKRGATLAYGERQLFKRHRALPYSVAVNTPRKGSTYWVQLTG